MYCPHCGKEISDQARFCGYCGSRTAGLQETAGPDPRKPAHKRAKIAGIVVCVAAVLILIPLALFAAFRFRTGTSAELSGKKEPARESLEREPTREDSTADAAVTESAPEESVEAEASFARADQTLPFAQSTGGNPFEAFSAGMDSVSVSWTRMNHSYWEEDPSGAFVNCYYDLAAVPEDTELGRRINAELHRAYETFLADNQIGGVYSGGYDEGEINYETGMEGMVAQNADGLLSLKYHHNWNMGGVGDGSCSGITIDLRTGERLYLSDIEPSDGSVITFQRMEEIALNFFGNCGVEVEQSLLDQFRAQSLDDLEFYVEEGQIILCIAKYELGPGAMGAPEIPTGIFCRLPAGDTVDIDARILPPSLTEFLQCFDFAYFTNDGDREFDCYDLENVYDRFPKGIVGNPTYVNVSLYTDDVESSWETESDPLGRHPAGMGYVMVSKDAVLWIMENVFNIPESEALGMLRATMAADPNFYEYEKNGTVYLCNMMGGVGGPGFEISYESVRYDGERYYIVYDCSDAIPTDASTEVYYAEMALKEKDGLEYWSLYYHSAYSPEPEPVPEIVEPAEPMPEDSGVSAWLGTWTAASGESLEIYDVSETGISLVFHKIVETGNMMHVDYEMEFDDSEKTIASEIGGPQDHGGWEYTFVLGDGYITVESRYPDELYYRE